MNTQTLEISNLINDLDQKGVKISTEDGKLRIHAPKGLLTPEVRQLLSNQKAEIIQFLNKKLEEEANNCFSNQDLSLQTIGRLIGGFGSYTTIGFKPPITSPEAMAKQLTITFRPLPSGYGKETIIKFREQLQQKLEQCGVRIIPWAEATKELTYEMELPLIKLKKSVKTRAIKANISAVIDVERIPSLVGKIKIWLAEQLYRLSTRYQSQNQPQSVSKIAQSISWAEENIKNIEDPTNTQVIVLTEPDRKFIDPKIPYEQKIPIGVSTLVRTFAEIVLGIGEDSISLLNMNLADASFALEELDNFVLNSLIPKIYVPILPLPMSRFEVGSYDPQSSLAAKQLVKLGQGLVPTGLLPAGFKLDDAIKRKSHRDIVDWMAKGRTGVSYGFVAYVEPPQYYGEREITELTWSTLPSIPGFSSEEIRLGENGRKYLKTQIGDRYTFKQIPDLWLVSSRSGSNKTNLNLSQDIVRVGLQDKLLLQLPQGIDPATTDIKPSYDLYVMVAIALGCALFLPDLVKNGAPIVHFHGYPDRNWFMSQEYFAGVNNPSVPCGTYESGVFNFLSLQNSVTQAGDCLILASLIEPDHGTNIVANDVEYLLSRLKTGIQQGQIELGSKHFASLKQGINTK
jgi:hypothetical protein